MRTGGFHLPDILKVHFVGSVQNFFLPREFSTFRGDNEFTNFICVDFSWRGVGVWCDSAGDADSRARTRSQVQVDYFIIPYTSTFIRLSYLYQECHAHCIVITNDGGWLIYIRVWVGGQGVVSSYICFAFLSCAFVFVSSRSESLYLGD